VNRRILLCGKRGGEKWRLHPLIHTLIGFVQAQDVEKKKAESRTPHSKRLNQDIVASPQEEKCGLKYVIFSFRWLIRTGDISA